MSEQFRWRLEEDEEAEQPALFAADSAMERRKGIGEFKGLEFLHVRAKKIINPVPGQSRMPFRFTINAYRGCSHACVYCFARPTHEYLNLNLGEDFDSKIVVKVNAVERLRAELRNKSWKGDAIAMGTNTDPYQRCEGKYRLTRGLIEVMSEMRNPFSVLTKSTLLLRDFDLIATAATRTDVQVSFSVGTLDSEGWRKSEPGTPHPKQRIEAIRRLAAAGVRTGVLVAPILPGISDGRDQIQAVVEAAVGAGAQSIGVSPLYLQPEVKEHWMKWLIDAYPNLVSQYEDLYSGRAYLPAAQRKEVSELGRNLVRLERRRQEVPISLISKPDSFRRNYKGKGGETSSEPGGNTAIDLGEQLMFPA